MKTKIKHLPLLFSLAALGASNSAWALTAAGTDINNTATISYDVGGTAQSDIGSSETGNTSGTGTPTTFKVDRVIDLNVTAGAASNVVPGSSPTTHTITYDLKNEGNDSELFNITFGQEAGDDFDTSSCSVTAAANSTAFTGTTITIPKETTANVTVTCTIPSTSTVSNGNTSDLEFVATATTAETNSNADDPAAVETVYGDASAGTTSDNAAKNGKHAAVNTWNIQTAQLTVQKTSTVVCDPYNDTTNPKRIPGSVVKYTITVSNAAAAGASANNVVITDPVPATMTYASTAPAGCSATVSAAATAVSGGATASGTTTGGATVTSKTLTMPANSTGTLTFFATVN